MAAAIVPASAEPQVKTIGNWLVSIEKDRFGDGDKVIAATGNGNSILALRYLQHELTFAVRDPTSIRGQTAVAMFKVSFKGGNHAVIDTVGDVIDESMIEVLVTDEMRS